MTALKYILFDLDGTLLRMDQEQFVNTYLARLSTYAEALGYDPQSTVRALWSGTGLMVANDGTHTNKQIFWENFERFFPGRREHADKCFESFYTGDFQSLSTMCSPDPMARQIIAFLKKSGIRAVLATNPVFPAVATQKRISWAGLRSEDFALITSYENSHYCKPNPKYYAEILEKIGAVAEQCLMVGNDVDEDMVAKEIGMNVFLLTNCLINKEQKDIDLYFHGDSGDLMNFLKERIPE